MRLLKSWAHLADAKIVQIHSLNMEFDKEAVSLNASQIASRTVSHNVGGHRCVYGVTVTRARPRSCGLACPHLLCTVTPISHLIYFYICAPLWSRAITPGVAFSGVSLMLTCHIQAGEAFSLYRDRYYTSVRNPAVCIAACLQFGLSRSTFIDIKKKKPTLGAEPLCVYLHGLCLCDFRVWRE